VLETTAESKKGLAIGTHVKMVIVATFWGWNWLVFAEAEVATAAAATTTVATGCDAADQE
jgi:hypothetical protein